MTALWRFTEEYGRRPRSHHWHETAARQHGSGLHGGQAGAARGSLARHEIARRTSTTPSSIRRPVGWLQRSPRRAGIGCDSSSVGWIRITGCASTPTFHRPTA